MATLYANAEVTITLFTSHAGDAHLLNCRWFVFFGVFVAKRFILQQKKSEEVNRKLPARNTTVQLLTLYTDPERHNAQRYRWTDRPHYDAGADHIAVKVKV